MIDQEALERIRDRIDSHNRKRNGRLTFSVEYGRGETYANRDVTIYAHDRYDRSSVLSGQDRRMWIWDFGSGPGAEQDAHDTIKAAKATRITEFMLGGGSTHVPIAQVVAHLPDDTDY